MKSDQEDLQGVRFDEEEDEMKLLSLSREEIMKYKTQGLCFLCKQHGHIKRNCPMNKNKSSGKQNF
jgi:hypothetical protein